MDEIKFNVQDLVNKFQGIVGELTTKLAIAEVEKEALLNYINSLKQEESK